MRVPITPSGWDRSNCLAPSRSRNWSAGYDRLLHLILRSWQSLLRGQDIKIESWAHTQVAWYVIPWATAVFVVRVIREDKGEEKYLFVICETRPLFHTLITVGTVVTTAGGGTDNMDEMAEAHKLPRIVLRPSGPVVLTSLVRDRSDMYECYSGRCAFRLPRAWRTLSPASNKETRRPPLR